MILLKIDDIGTDKKCWFFAFHKQKNMGGFATAGTRRQRSILEPRAVGGLKLVLYTH